MEQYQNKIQDCNKRKVTVLTTRRNIVGIGFSVLLLVMVAFFLGGPYSTALFKSKSHFIQHASAPRLYYEPGAEDHADKIALCLPTAVERVEQIHGLPYEDSFTVYVCATQRSMNEFLASNPSDEIRGMVLFGSVFIAPSAFNFIGRDTHKETLIHELSHLHFRQRLGFFKGRKHPVWFAEGFADYVAGSGGEGIEESEAIDFMSSGRHFVPEEEGDVFGSFNDAVNGLSGPMFHKQVRMFVTYLIESDSKAFKSFLREIQKGESFNDTFNKTTGSRIQDKWVQFLSQLNGEKQELPETVTP